MNGKVIALKFGTNAFCELCDMYGVEFYEMDKALKKPTGTRDLIFCAARMAALSSGKKVTFNKYQIGDWLDDMTQDDYKDILKAMNTTKIIGREIDVKEESK